jgi:PAS domain S-box-containing protein
VSPIRGHHLVRALEHVSTPVFLLDVNGVVGWTNAAGDELLGAESGTVVGQSFLRFVAVEAQAPMRDAFGRLARGESPGIDLPIAALRADGRRVDLEASLAGVRADEWVVGVLAVCLEATPRGR